MTATEKQIACIKWIASELGIPCPSDLSKEEASKFITEHLKAARDLLKDPDWKTQMEY